MFHAGDQIENPVTGERIVFHETSAETNGERVVFETIVQPGGFVASAHLHPFQTERFEVLEGTLAMRRGKEKVELGEGETIVVEPGTAHKFWNAGDGEVRFICIVTPAVQFERLIATMYRLAAAGKTNRKACRTRSASRSSPTIISTTCASRPFRTSSSARSRPRSARRPRRRLLPDLRPAAGRARAATA